MVRFIGPFMAAHLPFGREDSGLLGATRGRAAQIRIGNRQAGVILLARIVGTLSRLRALKE